MEQHVPHRSSVLQYNCYPVTILVLGKFLVTIKQTNILSPLRSKIFDSKLMLAYIWIEECIIIIVRPVLNIQVIINLILFKIHHTLSKLNNSLSDIIAHPLMNLGSTLVWQHPSAPLYLQRISLIRVK